MKRISFGDIERIRAFYLIVVPILLLVFVSSVFFLIMNSIAFRSEVRDVLVEQNSRARFAALDSLNYTRFVTTSIGRQISINYALRKGFDYKFINNLLAAYRDSSNQIISWSTFSWANKDHNILVSSNLGIMEKPIDLSGRDYIPLTQQYPVQIHFGKPVIGVISKAWSIPAGYGVLDQRGEYLGAVVTGVILDGLRNRILTAINNPYVSFALVDKQGAILTKSQGFDLDLAKDFLPKISELGSQEIFAEEDFFYQKVDEYPYGIVTFYNVNSGGGRFKYQDLYFLLLPIFSLIMLAIFYIIYRDFISPVSEISLAAEKILSGQKPTEKMPNFNLFEMRQIAKVFSLFERGNLR